MHGRACSSGNLRTQSAEGVASKLAQGQAEHSDAEPKRHVSQHDCAEDLGMGKDHVLNARRPHQTPRRTHRNLFGQVYAASQQLPWAASGLLPSHVHGASAS